MKELKPLIGIFGGTFDPVHYGHLKPAMDVKLALGMEQVLFLPNRIPPHRETPWLSVEQRKKLLKIAIEPLSGFEMDTRELERLGKSYMVDTLASLHEDFPDFSLCLILGMDAFAGLPQWHQWQKIPTLCHLVITRRPGFSWPTSPELKPLEANRVDSPSDLKKADTGGILLQSASQLEISSSEIRRRFQAGQSISDMVPDAVEHELKEMMRDT
jgi:nicotinate-nucleotide adenylyltransferase